MTASIQRAELLIDQGRFDLAEAEIRRALAADANDPAAHALLALCLDAQKKHRQAMQAARQAIALAPDFPFAHYVLAVAHHNQREYKEARACIHEAIRLDPAQADFRALLATTLFNAERWAEALAAADEGLALDAEHVECLNLRAMALTKLGRTAEAHQSISAALRRSPENADAHANTGWTLLNQNKPQQSLEHFREALRLEPGNDWARAGLVEALKARNPIYRLLLAYFLWMMKLDSRVRMGVIFGGYVVYRLMRGAAETQPQVTPFVLPFIILYIGFVWLTWLGVPLFNLILRLNPYGRYALNKQQLLVSNVFGAMLAAIVLSLVAFLIWPTQILLLLALILFMLTFPATNALSAPAGTGRMLRLVGLGGLTALALLALGLIGSGIEAGDGVFGAFLICFFIYLIAAAFLSARSPSA